MLTLILTEEGDVHADYVLKAIEQIGGKCIRFHTDSLVENTEYKFSFSDNQSFGKFIIKDNGLGFEIDEVTSVYYRRPKKPTAPSIVEDAGIRKFIENESEATLAGLYNTLSNVTTWINHPVNNRIAGNKIGQLSKASQLGLKIPPTLITNSVDEAFEFFQNCGSDMVCKSIRQELACVDGNSVFVFTHSIPKESSKDSFHGVNLGSSILQMRIHKVSDVRVTIVGNSFFSAQIDNSEIDWRKIDPYSLQHKVIDLPETLKKQLLKLQESYGLVSSQVDLLLTDKHEFVFLEMNPNGQWLWVELITGLPIAETIARKLAGKLS